MSNEVTDPAPNDLYSNVVVPLVRDYEKPTNSPTGSSIRSMENIIKQQTNASNYYEEVLNSLDLEFLLREIFNRRLQMEDKFTQTEEARAKAQNSNRSSFHQDDSQQNTFRPTAHCPLFSNESKIPPFNSQVNIHNCFNYGNNPSNNPIFSQTTTTTTTTTNIMGNGISCPVATKKSAHCSPLPKNSGVSLHDSNFFGQQARPNFTYDMLENFQQNFFGKNLSGGNICGQNNSTDPTADTVTNLNCEGEASNGTPGFGGLVDLSSFSKINLKKFGVGDILDSPEISRNLLLKEGKSSKDSGSISRKNKNVNSSEVAVKLYARTILEKILLDKITREDLKLLTKGLDGCYVESLRMILLVFYNQYYVSGVEQHGVDRPLQEIDFGNLFIDSKKMKVTIFRKIQKVKTLFKRHLSDKNETDLVTELETQSLKSEYKDFFLRPANFKLAQEYFQSLNFLNKYHFDLNKNLLNYVNQLYEKIVHYKGSNNLSTFFYRYIIQDQNPFIWSVIEIVTSVEAFQNNCSMKFEQYGDQFGDFRLVYDCDYNYTKKKKRQRENQRMLQRKDKVDQERWIGKLFGLSNDMIDVFDKSRNDKREVKEQKAKETLKKNSCSNVEKRSQRKNSSSKINQSNLEEKFLLHDIFTGLNNSSHQLKDGAARNMLSLLDKRVITHSSDSENDSPESNEFTMSPITPIKAKKLKVDSPSRLREPPLAKSLSFHVSNEFPHTSTNGLKRGSDSVTLSGDTDSQRKDSASIQDQEFLHQT